MRRRLHSYLTGALDLLERSALFGAAVDWAATRGEADAVLENAKQYTDTYDFLDGVLARAGGPHSGLSHPGGRRQLTSGERDALGPPTPTGRIIDGTDGISGADGTDGSAGTSGIDNTAGPIAYLRLPRTDGADRRGTRYTAAGASTLRTLTAARPRGWIVDLRANIGGNMWPMLAVASPLLPEGVLGFFEDREGRFQTFGTTAGSAFLDSRRMARLDGYAELSQHDDGRPVAVIVSAHTASAGEAVALAFRGLPEVCLLGSPTRGLTTANLAHTLRDKTVMRITNAHYADRGRVRCTGPIPVERDLTGQGRRAALDAALDWIGRR